MKKFLTLRNIVLCCGALLLLVAFFLSFAASVKVFDSGVDGVFKNAIWGCREVQLPDQVISIGVIFGTEKVGPAVLPFLGVLFMLLAALGAILVALLVKKPWAKWVVVGLAVLAIAGAVFQFFIYTQLLRAGVNASVKEGLVEKSYADDFYQTLKTHFDKGNPRFAVSVAMGILGILGGLAVGASQLLPEKK